MNYNPYDDIQYELEVELMRVYAAERGLDYDSMSLDERIDFLTKLLDEVGE